MVGTVPLLVDPVLVVDNHVFIYETLSKYMLDHDLDMDVLGPTMNILDSIKQIGRDVVFCMNLCSPFDSHPLLPCIDSLFVLVNYVSCGIVHCALSNVVVSSWVGGYYVQNT